MRLVAGPGDWEGRVEVFTGTEWGSICDSSDQASSWPTVVCYELGYGDAIQYTVATTSGTGLIAMKDPLCSASSEAPKRFSQCLTGGNSCDHSTDRYIKCQHKGKSHLLYVVYS